MAQKLLTRDKYKELKKMDRQQVESFICSIYASGWEDAKRQLNSLDPDEFQREIRKLRGIGEVKSREIKEILVRMMSGEGTE